MLRPHPSQIRAARALLDWSMIDLARAARISVSVVRRYESVVDRPVPEDLVAAMQGAAETEGIRFLTDDGTGIGVTLLRPQGASGDPVRPAGPPA